jgi:hypothetical protein
MFRNGGFTRAEAIWQVVQRGSLEVAQTCRMIGPIRLAVGNGSDRLMPMPATRSNSGLTSGLYSALVTYVRPVLSASSLKAGRFVCAAQR